MDTIVGRGNYGAIVTLTERSTNMLLMRKLKHGKNADKLAEAVIHLLWPYKNVIRTITTDNGLEFASHEKITKSIGVPVYFTDPYSSWQKGAIENINGLIRQYIPKSTTFEHISQQQITRIMEKITIDQKQNSNFQHQKSAL